MNWGTRSKSLLCGFLWLVSSLFYTPVSGQTPPPCPPGGEPRDYGTGCSPSFAIVYGGLGTAGAWLTETERRALFEAGNSIQSAASSFLQNPITFPRLPHNKDYFDTSPTSPWRQWYDKHKNALEAARLYYWAIYTVSQDLPDSDPRGCPEPTPPVTRECVLKRMRDATALIATGHLIFGQQFLIRATNLRYSEELGSDRIIEREQCLLSGRRFQDSCEYNDAKANADYQFEEVLTDYSRVFGLPLRDGTSLGQYLGMRELDLFRLAAERSAQVNDAVARNLYALGDEQRPRTIYRDVIGARYVQTAAVIDTLLRGPREQAITLATQLTTLRQSTRNLIERLNPLGFDLKYSPLLSYGDQTQGVYGLAYEAVNGTGGALQLERDARTAANDYNSSLARQRQELAAIRNQYFGELATLCGITPDQAGTLTVDQVGVLCNNDNAGVKVKYNLMQAGLANVNVVRERLKQIPDKLRISLDRDAKVIDATWTAGQEFAVIDFATEILKGINVTFSESVGFPQVVSASVTYSFNPYAPALGALAAARDLIQAAKEVQITLASSVAAVRTSLLDMAYEVRNLEVAKDSANAAIVEYNNALHRVRTRIALRDQAVRDETEDHDTINVLRILNNRQALDAIAKFNDAIRRTYLVAKVVEYETMLPLSGPYNPNLLFKIRRATELNDYLSLLNLYHASFDFRAYLNRFTYPNISMTRDILGFNRAALQCDPDFGTNCQACFFDDLPSPICCNGDREIDCQERIFREFVRRNTTGQAPDPQTLVIEFSTPLDAVYPGATDAIFLPMVGGNKLAGVGDPLPESKGVWITFRTSQSSELRTAAMRLTQSGHSLYRNPNGCELEFSPRSALAFLPYPIQISNPDQTSAVIVACLSTDSMCFNPTRAFLRRSVYASNWRLEVQAGPRTPNPNLDLSKLQDIILNLDTTGFTITGTCQP